MSDVNQSIEKNKNEIQLNRDCAAILIPHGIPITMVKGESISVMQQLGGSFTVYYNGNLARIDGQDADAIGLAVPKEYASHSDPLSSQLKEIVGDGFVDEEDIWSKLKTCYDPEIPVNIVDLGLIYECEVHPIVPGDINAGNCAVIKMTLTAPGCGMGPYIVDDVKRKVLEVPNVFDAKVELVWDPPWGQDMMSEEAQLTLGLL